MCVRDLAVVGFNDVFPRRRYGATAVRVRRWLSGSFPGWGLRRFPFFRDASAPVSVEHVVGYGRGASRALWYRRRRSGSVGQPALAVGWAFKANVKSWRDVFVGAPQRRAFWSDGESARAVAEQSLRASPVGSMRNTVHFGRVAQVVPREQSSGSSL